MINKLRVWWLRRRAGAAYIKYMKIYEEATFGESLLLSVNGRATAAACRFDGLMRRLRRVDPDFPQGWKPLLETREASTSTDIIESIRNIEALLDRMGGGTESGPERRRRG